MPKYACEEYKKVFAMLEEEKIFVDNQIPQLADMSAFLQSKSVQQGLLKDKQFSSVQKLANLFCFFYYFI